MVHVLIIIWSKIISHKFMLGGLHFIQTRTWGSWINEWKRTGIKNFLYSACTPWKKTWLSFSKEKYIIFTTLYVTIFSIIVTWSLLINFFYRLFALEKHNDYGLSSNYSSNQYFPHCQNILKYIWLLSQLIQSFFTNVVKQN